MAISPQYKLYKFCTVKIGIYCLKKHIYRILVSICFLMAVTDANSNVADS